MRRSVKTSGFTTIELLVVIAIIVILAAIALISVESARSKAGNSAIQSNLDTIRSQSALMFSNTGSYTGLCSNTTVLNALNSAKAAGHITGATITTLTTGGTSNTAVCHENGSVYAIATPLRSPSSDSWCIDANQKAVQMTGYLAPNATNCP